MRVGDMGRKASMRMAWWGVVRAWGVLCEQLFRAGRVEHSIYAAVGKFNSRVLMYLSHNGCGSLPQPHATG